MGAMMTATEMRALAKATGPEFDNMGLTLMVRHHEGALTMSETVQADGKSPEVQTLAQNIITSQKVEIDEMNKLVSK
jgi:uncharacterized protein (DUF305 family)